MPDFKDFYLFLTVSLLVNLAPGPDMIYTAARSLSQGTKAGIFSALGIFTGCLFHIAAAVFGLSAIITQSILLFSIIKYAGAAYLIYLGFRAWFSDNTRGPVKLYTVGNGRIFLQGVITNVLNPKVAIFFLSFLPQFIDPSSPNIKQQVAFLGLWFDVQGALILIIVATVIGMFRNMLSRRTGFWKWQEKVTGVVLVALGIRMFFTKK
jgi:threonine/homoserine/homoserine lactone efflux protein